MPSATGAEVIPTRNLTSEAEGKPCGKRENDCDFHEESLEREARQRRGDPRRVPPPAQRRAPVFLRLVPLRRAGVARLPIIPARPNNAGRPIQSTFAHDAGGDVTRRAPLRSSAATPPCTRRFETAHRHALHA
jgi:hypothetical protein